MFRKFQQIMIKAKMGRSSSEQILLNVLQAEHVSQQVIQVADKVFEHGFSGEALGLQPLDSICKIFCQLLRDRPEFNILKIKYLFGINSRVPKLSSKQGYILLKYLMELEYDPKLVINVLKFLKEEQGSKEPGIYNWIE